MTYTNGTNHTNLSKDYEYTKVADHRRSYSYIGSPLQDSYIRMHSYIGILICKHLQFIDIRVL
jgi:hypothetical protein